MVYFAGAGNPVFFGPGDFDLSRHALLERIPPAADEGVMDAVAYSSFARAGTTVGPQTAPRQLVEGLDDAP